MTSIMTSPTRAGRQQPSEWPREPQTVAETGLDFGLLLDLTLKSIYSAGRPSARLIGERMGLSFAVVNELLQFLRKQEYVEIVGSTGAGELDYQFAPTSKGLEKTREALEKTQYVGPAPVPFDLYAHHVALQSVRSMAVSAGSVGAALANLVLEPALVERIGTAFASGRSIFLHGEPGNGKSSIAEATAAMLPGEILVPYAFEIYGQIVRVFDPRVHLPAKATAADDASGEGDAVAPSRVFEAMQRPADKRWCVARRPVVIAGGELTLADLELGYSPTGKFYVAPLQVKANNGVFVIDDFGRQRLSPAELLNRWLVPMDRRVDHLSLQTGESFELTFDTLLIFATNIEPEQLGDEAFFRRIRHKIRIGDPDEATYRRILAAAALGYGIVYEKDVADYLIEKYYRRAGRPFRGVHPRDIVELLIDSSRYRGRQPEFSFQQIDQACASYFLRE